MFDVGVILVDLCDVINDLDENFGVIVNIINMGMEFKFVFILNVLGVGNDLVIINDIVEFDNVLIFVNDGVIVGGIVIVVDDEVKSVEIKVDGILIVNDINIFKDVV